MCNRIMRLVLQSDFFRLHSYLAPRKHLDRVCTSKHIIYYVSHLISVMNVLSRFMRPACCRLLCVSLFKFQGL